MEKFVCKIDAKVIYDLNIQISKNRIINWAPDFNDQAGISFDDLSYILDYWKNKFSWEKSEKELNSFNQFYEHEFYNVQEKHSFDRKEFDFSFVKGLEFEDAVATLTYFTALVISQNIKKNFLRL
mgnify:CR=1 FL=1